MSRCARYMVVKYRGGHCVLTHSKEICVGYRHQNDNHISKDFYLAQITLPSIALDETSVSHFMKCIVQISAAKKNNFCFPQIFPHNKGNVNGVAKANLQ